MVSSCYLQQHQILSWEPVSGRNRGTQTSSPFLCRVALLQVARKCCVMVWISQFFHCVFLQRMGAVSESSDLVTVPGPQWIHDLVPLSFSCFLLMCCGNWNNVFSLQAKPSSPAVLQQCFPDGNISPTLSEYTCQPVRCGMCLVCYVPDGWILTPCAHPFWCLLLPPGFHFTPALPILLPQAGCLPFGKTFVSLGVAGGLMCRGSSKSCPSPEQWNFVFSKSRWPECCSKRVWCLLPLFRMRELQSNIKKAARALNYSAMEHCHSSIKLFWPVVFYGVHCS